MSRQSKKKPSDSYDYSSADRSNLPTEQTESLIDDDTRGPLPYTPDGRNDKTNPEEVTPNGRERDEEPVLAWQRELDPTKTTYDAFPLYVKEKVHPGAFARWLQDGNAADAAEQALFDDFNGLPSDDAKFEWYQHKGNWQNRLIHGESAQVMSSLLRREGMAGQVQMIYFDPPYGINFKSNFQPASDDLNVTENAKGLPNDPRTIRAFRDTYTRGIHSYLDQMLEKLTLARELLSETGSMFVQIGDENVMRVGMLMDEVFGPENRISLIPFVTRGSSSAKKLPSVADFFLWYAKDASRAKYRQLYEDTSDFDEWLSLSTSFSGVDLPNGKSRYLTADERTRGAWRDLPPGSKYFTVFPVTSQGEAASGTADAPGRSDPWYPKNPEDFFDLDSIQCPRGRHWSVSHDGLDRLAETNRLFLASEDGYLRWKRYLEETPGRRSRNVWADMANENSKRYVVQTAEKTIRRAMLMSTDPGDLVLDITCGSGTTATVAETWGRRWITCDTSPVTIAIARQRIAAQTYPYWVLHDSEEGVAAEAKLVEEAGGTPARPVANATYGHDPAKGFVYRRVPFVSAKTLAYGLTQTPTHLVDDPERADEKVRLASPFTVESTTATTLAPMSGHPPPGGEPGTEPGTEPAAASSIEPAANPSADSAADPSANPAAASSDDRAKDRSHGPKSGPEPPPSSASAASSNRDAAYVDRILETLQRTGASNVFGDEALEVLAIEPLPEPDLVTHELTYATEGGPARGGLLVAPEDSPVTREVIRLAAQEAREHISQAKTLFVVAYESELGSQPHDGMTDRVGAVEVVHIRPHRDLQLDELKDEKGHRAFTMLGEPEVKIHEVGDDGEVEVEVLGFDTFDPRTGETTHGDAKGDIACWMIDTSFDGESFFARRLHFPATGEKDMRKLAKDLGVGLDTLRFKRTLTTRSAPFKPPAHGRIAVRIITTTGDEMTLEIPDTPSRTT